VSRRAKEAPRIQETRARNTCHPAPARLPMLLRRFTAELAGSRHAVMERDRIEVESVWPSKCTKFHENACEERGIFERAYHLSVARRRRRKIMHAGRAIGKSDP